MKAFFALGVSLLVASQIHAQTNPTYIVQLTGDTVFVEVKHTSKLHHNNREVFTKENNRTVRYLPKELKAFFNGTDVYESKVLFGNSFFLHRKISGPLSLYTIDYTVIQQWLLPSVNKPALVGGAIAGIAVGVATGVTVIPVAAPYDNIQEIPVVEDKEGNGKLFNPNHKDRMKEIEEYFVEYPPIKAFITGQPFSPGIYAKLVTDYNVWKRKGGVPAQMGPSDGF